MVGGVGRGARCRVPWRQMMLWLSTGQGAPPQLQCSPVFLVFPAGILQPTLYDPEFPQ